MKIEKLTENKIRVVVPSSELGFTYSNLSTIMTKAMETQTLFSTILKKAEKEVDFYTDGYKLLIEAFSSSEDMIVFTITKFLPTNSSKEKKLVVRKKTFSNKTDSIVCSFESFDAFCDFCKAFKSLHNTKNVSFPKKVCLYLWKDRYYLILKNKNMKHEDINLLCFTLSEFGTILSCSNSFESKLIEHGEVLIKKNAIDVGIEFLI